ncbi:carbohydrate kinase [Zobellia galactanivorans]|uniref:carbohydrate kinase family protein n=1 Tax=Zobellia galactanivorans (strain DSM 12802 / CCUG 47099 / CIP 106680 / NCIMB 13871 / Dsij) TaxID=63186 RepID=UPI0026E2DAC6|nr:carbohydrate kinase [Zobellia galactanivorans]MDO6808789.1 carbohydrate kinase [Zobellia galactanivorans]
MKNIVCFGEVLWDVFPTHEKIGGAPLNVALRLQSLGNQVSIISRIGEDEKGKEIEKSIIEKGVNAENLQVDQELNTGIVQVSLSQNGSASYDITFPRAWDNIKIDDKAIKATQGADAFIYGSLVARDKRSKHTLYELLKLAKYKIFDVNLRAPYYNMEVLGHLMKAADFIKFNDDEILEIGQELGSESNALEQNISFIAKRTDTKSICVTRGAHGAILYYKDNFYENKGYPIEVVDTVGAGDSFLASLTNGLIKMEDPQKTIDFACAIGAMVAGREGANPIFTPEEIQAFIKSRQ